MFIDDVILEQAAQALTFQIWRPKETMVVLGAANEARYEVFSHKCQELGVPVLKRAGGGGAVVLYPGCAVVSLGLWVKHQFQNSQYFEKINAAVIEALRPLDPVLNQLGQRGFSDITFGERKIAGTSLFRSKHYLLYQASLLVDLDIDLLNHCLPHPTREPDYRQGKTHAEFLLGLSELVPGLTVERVCESLRLNLESALQKCLQGELIPPELGHLPHLLKRARGEGALDKK